jgi:hypothetical protein
MRILAERIIETDEPETSAMCIGGQGDASDEDWFPAAAGTRRPSTSRQSTNGSRKPNLDERLLEAGSERC